MNKNLGALVVDARGFENLDFQEKAYQNFIDKARKLKLGKGGGEALTEYFKRMRLQNDGARLLSSEDTSTFVWLFRAWLKCMDGRAPKAIITNQDQAMKSAIALTCAEFEMKWGQLIQKYELGDNAWLQGLYNERSFWVPAYLKGVFRASISTTQRSESMNAFFNGFVHYSTTLKEFVNQFDNALRKKVELETTADFQPNHPINEGCISTYDILDEITTDDNHVKSVKYTVYFNQEEMNKIYVLPDKNILNRWRKDLKRRYTVVKSSYDDLRQNTDSQRKIFDDVSQDGEVSEAPETDKW
ncbi:protein FAR1-RELATED SEQUENCE 12-like [Carya illinoinensis]|uniref:protein FAR1-RELATED SEQUENCE 12-like n=1 Tax=Carya illinoinensis TaxID=32201 RepID=UPI001C71F032|nr:protein FAR1-RELATED SEQUENCE 12-like [Carya illinoinensis]